jgi:hypothetical protein
MRKFRVAFQEGKHSALSISKLIFSIEDKVRVLKHTNEWHPADVSMLPAMALNTTSHNSDAFHDYIHSQVKLQLSKILSSLQGQDGSNKPSPKSTYPEWMFVAPADMSEIKHWNGKDWHWCAKCHNGRGQWASTHDTSTHVDGFRFERHSRL